MSARSSGWGGLLTGAAALAGASLASAVPGAAQQAADANFYKGKEITIYIGTGPGTTYDLYARMLARHMGRHIPGEPKIIPSNRTGAGSLNAYNSLYNTAPRDGTVIATGHRFVPIMPLFGMAGPQFDALKFQYIGSMSRETGVCIARNDVGINSWQDLKTKELRVGTTGAGSELTTFTNTLVSTLGLKLVSIRGYPSAVAIDLALEQNEVQGRCGASYGSIKATKPQWLSQKQIVLLVQLGLTKERELPDVPLIGDLITDPTDKRAIEVMLGPAEMARPYLAPPDVPKARIEILRKAFDAVLKDPALVEEAHKANVELSPLTGDQVESIVTRAYQAPQDAVERARKLVGSEM